LTKNLEEIDSYLGNFEKLIKDNMDTPSSFKDSYKSFMRQYNNFMNTIKLKKDKEKLFDNSKYSTSGGKNTSQLQLLVEENHSIDNSQNNAKAFLEQAIQTKKVLKDGNQSLKTNTHKMRTTNGIFQSISSIMSMIRTQKLKHTFIIGTVISLCIVFIIWYSYY